MDKVLSAQVIAAIVIVLFLALAAVWIFIRKQRKKTDAFEDMEGHEFEFFCADLLRDRGFVEVEVTRGSGDYGIDILAEKDGVTYAIQCLSLIHI